MQVNLLADIDNGKDLSYFIADIQDLILFTLYWIMCSSCELPWYGHFIRSHVKLMDYALQTNPKWNETFDLHSMYSMFNSLWGDVLKTSVHNLFNYYFYQT